MLELATLVRRGVKCARTDEMVKSASMGVQSGPIVKGKIDDRKSSCRKALVQALASFNVA